MNRLNSLWSRLTHLLRSRHFDDDLQQEIAFHIEARADELERSGMTRAEALATARRAFGSDLRMREQSREPWRFRWLDDAWLDLRYALRMLRRTPVFTLTALGTLALGIGLNTGLFSIVNAVLIRPLPFPDANRLVSIGGITTSNPLNAFDRKVFASLAHFSSGTVDLTDVGDAVRVAACSVTPTFFRTFGVRPQLGRDFRPDEGADGVNDVAIISDAFWQGRLGGRPDAVGAHIRLNGKSHRVIGVGPAGFSFPGATTVWLASDFGRARFFLYQRPDESGPQLGTLGRLRANISIEQARTAAKMGQRQYEDGMARLNPRQRFGHSDVGLAPLQDRLVRSARPSLLVLFGAVGCVLLVACTNVANMLYARGARRRHELAVRASLGAGRVRLVRQLVTESVLLAVLGGIVGLLLAVWTTKTFAVLVPANLPGLTGVARTNPVLDVRVFALTALTCLLAGIFGGLASSRRLTRSKPAALMSRTALTSVPRTRLRSALIFLQVAACVVLLVAAGLMIRTLAALQHADPGFDAENVVTMEISLPMPAGLSRAEAYKQRLLQQNSVLQRISAIRRIDAFALADQLPLDPSGAGGQFFAVDPPRVPSLPFRTAVTIDVSAAYFRAMGVRILHGRAFTEQEVAEERPVAIVDETLAARYWTRGDAVGKRIKVANGWYDVIGVANNVPYSGPAASADRHTDLQIYLPGTSGGYYIFRSTLAPASLVSLVRAEMHRVDKDAVISRVRAMRELLAGSTASPRELSLLLAAFAVLALLLAAVGIYGVVSFLVAERTNEIGVRLALGADRRRVVWMVLRQAIMPVVSGAVAGTGCALVLSRLLKSLLFGVAPNDLAAFLLATLVTVVVGVVAAYIPALRTTRIDPILALRCE